MSVTLVVAIRARSGEEDRVRRGLRELAARSREEPGCQAFEAHRSADEPARFLLHERYDDEAALVAHRASAHFARYSESVLPLLDERVVTRWEPLSEP